MNCAASKLTQLSATSRKAAAQFCDSHFEQLHLKLSFVWVNDGPQSFQNLGGVSRKAILGSRALRPTDPTVPTLHISSPHCFVRANFADCVRNTSLLFRGLAGFPQEKVRLLLVTAVPCCL